MERNLKNASSENSSDLKQKKIAWIRWFRWVVAISVVAALVYTVVKSSEQLRASNFSFAQVNWLWWGAAIVVYVATMTLSWSFWHRVLLALDQQASPLKTLLAFFASQLGKYVPGKAMVVVIRTDMIRSDQVQTAPAAASVFVETLTWLFVGSVIGCLLLIFHFRDQTVLMIAAALMTVTAGILTTPPVFRSIANRLVLTRNLNSPKLFDGLDWRTMSFGWIVMAIGWLLNGMSLWLVLYGIAGTDITMADFPLTLACVCLATVAGFVSLLPGGLGVRELVMIPLLGSRFGMATAMIAAIAIRLVWLTAELITSGFLFIRNRNRERMNRERVN